MRKRVLYGTLLLALLVVAIGIQAYRQRLRSQYQTGAQVGQFDTAKRPFSENLLFDYANLLQDFHESTNLFLKTNRDRYHIEAAIVTLPTMTTADSIEVLADKILNGWQLGREFNGRALLLLVVENKKQVKLEVSYELEDVFTDAFTGYIEDIQLRPYFLSGQLGVGLVAVMEELEQRAQIKQRGNYNQSTITALDQQLLTGGAGAKRDLKTFLPEQLSKVGKQYPAGKDAESAWQTLLRAWKDRVNDPNLGVYTEVTKLAYRDYVNSPKSRLERNYQTWSGRTYEIIQDRDYAVVSFGNNKGWDNSPFLFARTPEGWKLDLVSTRKFVRMGNSPSWGVERADHPYIALLDYAPQWVGQDIPWQDKDVYRVANDPQVAAAIRRLEKKIKQHPNDFDTALELGRLNTIASMRPKHIFPPLKKARSLKPDHPLPHKYLAIAHVSTTYQYKSAIKEIKRFLQLSSQSPFGWKYLGYLHYQTKHYDDAVEAFKKSMAIDQGDAYTFTWLARAYGRLYLNAAKVDPRRALYKSSAKAMLQKTHQLVPKNLQRIAATEVWLMQAGIL